jgi:molybdopterin-guanine dinucleotide biosynthesis protein A
MNLSAVLLAGGESRRMGRDKAMLVIDGIPLWQRQMALLRELDPAALFVSARARPAWLPAEARFIADAPAGRGPLAAIAATLPEIETTHLLALAVDMPAMSAWHIATLWRHAAPRCGVLPWLDDRPEPFPAIYPVEASPIANKLLAGPDVSMIAFTRELLAASLMEKHVIGSPDASLYANCNSPADWQPYAASEETRHD